MSGTPQPDSRVEIRDVPKDSRYELYLEGLRIGFLDYTARGGTFTARHTEIDPAYGGRGLGEQLVRHVLDEMRDTGMALRPLCPFVKRFVERHPEYDDLVVSKKGT